MTASKSLQMLLSCNGKIYDQSKVTDKDITKKIRASKSLLRIWIPRICFWASRIQIH